jgi:hypothetical protein
MYNMFLPLFLDKYKASLSLSLSRVRERDSTIALSSESECVPVLCVGCEVRLVIGHELSVSVINPT